MSTKANRSGMNGSNSLEETANRLHNALSPMMSFLGSAAALQVASMMADYELSMHEIASYIPDAEIQDIGKAIREYGAGTVRNMVAAGYALPQSWDEVTTFIVENY